MDTLIYFILCLLQPICLPVPEMATVIWGSSKIGENISFILGVGGTCAGIAIMYILSNRCMLYLGKKIYIQEKIKQFQFYIKDYCFFIIGLLFVVPILPDEMICIGAAVCGISLSKLLLVAVFAKSISIGMVVFSDQIAKLFSLNKYEIIVAEIIILFIMAKLFKQTHQVGGKPVE